MTLEQGSLYIVSTPIGNLDDITYRAVDILNKVDICASEDTRVSRILFKKYDISTKLISYHKFSEKSKINFLINLLKSGKDIALISDAGTPLISDPGQYLVEAAIENQIKTIPIPGPTSVIAALSVSGFNLETFTFYGFFPRKLKEKKKILKEIASSNGPSVIFESGRRLEKLIDTLSEELNEKCKILIAREMTKMHETLYRGKIKNIKDLMLASEFGLKGEFVIVLDSAVANQNDNLPYEDKRIIDILMNKLDKKLALEIGSEILQKKRNDLYQLKLED
tara:strand:+ start:734 stop:1573 length:840 start_codon:yes stop_codon:yes gene_type:complete